MPIIPSITTTRISQAEFKELSFEVMRHVFDIHNEFGRLFDEKVYKRELAFRMESIATEVSVDLIHGTFFKQLFADMIVSQGGLFEFKMAESIHSRHRSQIIQYLLLFDLAHGKIVNMQTEQVQHEFVNCHQSLSDLRRFDVELDQFQSSVAGAGDFSAQLIAILQDWGTGLDVSLYEEAVVHCLGGENLLSSLVSVFGRHGHLADMRMPLVAPSVAFRLTALPDREETFEIHARRWIEHTSLEAIHWANIRNNRVVLKTIR